MIRRSSAAHGPRRARKSRQQIAADGDRCQRKRALHPLLPHRAEIRQQCQSLRLIREPPFVNEHAAVDCPAKHSFLDLIEPHQHFLEAAQQVQQQRGSRAFAGDRHAAADTPRGPRPTTIGPTPNPAAPPARSSTYRSRIRAYAAIEIFVTSASPRSARALSASTSSMWATTRARARGRARGRGTRTCRWDRTRTRSSAAARSTLGLPPAPRRPPL